MEKKHKEYFAIIVEVDCMMQLCKHLDLKLWNMDQHLRSSFHLLFDAYTLSFLIFSTFFLKYLLFDRFESYKVLLIISCSNNKPTCEVRSQQQSALVLMQSNNHEFLNNNLSPSCQF